MAEARWLFPAPGGPKIRQLAFLGSHASPAASALTWRLGGRRHALKSKEARLLPGSRRASPRWRWMRLLPRSASSCSTSAARNGGPALGIGPLGEALPELVDRRQAELVEHHGELDGVDLAGVGRGLSVFPACRASHAEQRPSLPGSPCAASIAPCLDRPINRVAFEPISRRCWSPSCGRATSSSWTTCPATRGPRSAEGSRPPVPNSSSCRPTLPSTPRNGLRQAQGAAPQAAERTVEGLWAQSARPRNLQTPEWKLLRRAGYAT